MRTTLENIIKKLSEMPLYQSITCKSLLPYIRENMVPEQDHSTKWDGKAYLSLLDFQGLEGDEG